jgi:hypothetical protein
MTPSSSLPLKKSVLPGGRRHGHFPQMWQFLKAEWPRKFMAVKVALILFLKAVIWQLKKLAL